MSAFEVNESTTFAEIGSQWIKLRLRSFVTGFIHEWFWGAKPELPIPVPVAPGFMRVTPSDNPQVKALKTSPLVAMLSMFWSTGWTIIVYLILAGIAFNPVFFVAFALYFCWCFILALVSDAPGNWGIKRLATAWEFILCCIFVFPLLPASFGWWFTMILFRIGAPIVPFDYAAHEKKMRKYPRAVEPDRPPPAADAPTAEWAQWRADLHLKAAERKARRDKLQGAVPGVMENFAVLFYNFACSNVGKIGLCVYVIVRLYSLFFEKELREGNREREKVSKSGRVTQVIMKLVDISLAVFIGFELFVDKSAACRLWQSVKTSRDIMRSLNESLTTLLFGLDADEAKTNDAAERMDLISKREALLNLLRRVPKAESKSSMALELRKQLLEIRRRLAQLGAYPFPCDQEKEDDKPSSVGNGFLPGGFLNPSVEAKENQPGLIPIVGGGSVRVTPEMFMNWMVEHYPGIEPSSITNAHRVHFFNDVIEPIQAVSSRSPKDDEEQPQVPDEQSPPVELEIEAEFEDAQDEEILPTPPLSPDTINLADSVGIACGLDPDQRETINKASRIPSLYTRLWESLKGLTRTHGVQVALGLMLVFAVSGGILLIYFRDEIQFYFRSKREGTNRHGGKHWYRSRVNHRSGEMEYHVNGTWIDYDKMCDYIMDYDTAAEEDFRARKEREEQEMADELEKSHKGMFLFGSGKTENARWGEYEWVCVDVGACYENGRMRAIEADRKTYLPTLGPISHHDGPVHAESYEEWKEKGFCRSCPDDPNCVKNQQRKAPFYRGSSVLVKENSVGKDHVFPQKRGSLADRKPKKAPPQQLEASPNQNVSFFDSIVKAEQSTLAQAEQKGKKNSYMDKQIAEEQSVVARAKNLEGILAKAKAAKEAHDRISKAAPPKKEAPLVGESPPSGLTKLQKKNKKRKEKRMDKKKGADKAENGAGKVTKELPQSDLNQYKKAVAANEKAAAKKGKKEGVHIQEIHLGASDVPKFVTQIYVKELGLNMGHVCNAVGFANFAITTNHDLDPKIDVVGNSVDCSIKLEILKESTTDNELCFIKKPPGLKTRKLRAPTEQENIILCGWYKLLDHPIDLWIKDGSMSPEGFHLVGTDLGACGCPLISKRDGCVVGFHYMKHSGVNACRPVTQELIEEVQAFSLQLASPKN
jgi:hypothetical protein